MLSFAVTSLEKIEKVPPLFWLKALGVLAAFIAAIVVLRKVARMNKVVLAVISAVVITVVGFSWVYERNEPAFMTPIVDKIAPFFPSKGSYGGKQQQGPRI
jgi:hypothetical protein